MRGLVIFVLLVVIIVSFSFIALSQVGDDFEFSTFTSAVCEGKNGFRECKDILFVNCNGNIKEINKTAECDGMKIEMPKVTGFIVFEN